MTDDELWTTYGCGLTLKHAASYMAVSHITFGLFMRGLASRYTEMTGQTIPQYEYGEMMRTLARETMLTTTKLSAFDKDKEFGI